MLEGLKMTRDNGTSMFALCVCSPVRRIGVYVIVGQYTDNGDIQINPHLHVNKKHIDVRWVFVPEMWGIQRSSFPNTGAVGAVTFRISTWPS